MSDTFSILDTSVFVQAHRQYYPFDVTPAFWDALLDCARRSCLARLDAVDREITGRDELFQWARIHHSDLFRSTDVAEVTEAYGRVIAWVTNNPQYLESAKSTFSSGADGWVIAFAMPRGHIVVTQEVSSPTSRSTVKIPDVCAAMNVQAINTVEMMRRIGVRLDGFSTQA